MFRYVIQAAGLDGVFYSVPGLPVLDVRRSKVLFLMTRSVDMDENDVYGGSKSTINRREGRRRFNLNENSLQSRFDNTIAEVDQSLGKQWVL